jgi:hypothetical protein
MTNRAAAFQGTIHSFKTIPSRSVVSISIEVDIGQLADVARIAEHGAWVAVARIQKVKEETTVPAPKRDWRDLQPAQQAGIRANDALFVAYLKEQRPDDWHEAADDPAACIRLICGVHSRVELGTDHRARVMWHSLDNAFQAWAAKERS